MLTHQMAIVITPLLESNNTRYGQLARQVNRIASIVDAVEEPVAQPRVRPRGHVENIDQENVLPPLQKIRHLMMTFMLSTEDKTHITFYKD